MNKIYTVTEKQKLILPKMMVFAFTSEDVGGRWYNDLLDMFNLGSSPRENFDLSDIEVYRNVNETYGETERESLNLIREQYLRRLGN